MYKGDVPFLFSDHSLEVLFSMNFDWNCIFENMIADSSKEWPFLKSFRGHRYTYNIGVGA